MLLYIINLESSLDRKQSMIDKIKLLAKKSRYKIFLESTLLNDNVLDSKEEFYFSFFSATNAKDIEAKKIEIKNYSIFLTKLIRGKGLSFGELACFSSHYLLWNKCVSLDSNIIVLEDDISFGDSFLDSIIDIKNKNFEYVRLMYLCDRKNHQLIDNFYISYENISGTQGYFLSPIGARKFIKNARIWFHCVDNYMDMFFIHKVKNIIYKPFCISEDKPYSSNSTIKKIDINKPRGFYKLTREISRFLLFSVYKNFYLLIKYKGW